MRIDMRCQIEHGNGFPLTPVRILTGSAAALEIVGIPTRISGCDVRAVAVTITNADGAKTTLPAELKCGAGGEPVWCVVLAQSCFMRYGDIQRGIRISATLDSAGAPLDTVLAVGRLSIVPGDADAVPGDPTAAIAIKGGDIFIKSRIVGGAQHYVKQEVVFDADMGAWGATWTGDYILDGGEFVAVENAD